jgi:predicted Fe-Mo cluster-binding NifX family protein
MIIATASHGNDIDDHFGHCEHFKIFTIGEDRKIINEEILESPAGCGCKSNIAGILSGRGVSLMLAGNMGGGAVQKLAESGIRVVRGCSGNAKNAVESFISGNVHDNGVSCGEHGHDCGNHHKGTSKN